MEVQALVSRIHEMRLETILVYEDGKSNILPGTVYYRYFHTDDPYLCCYISVEKDGNKSSYCSLERMNKLIQSGLCTYIYPVSSYFSLLSHSFSFCRRWLAPDLSARIRSFENVCDDSEKLTVDTIEDQSAQSDDVDYF